MSVDNFIFPINTTSTKNISLSDSDLHSIQNSAKNLINNSHATLEGNKRYILEILNIISSSFKRSSPLIGFEKDMKLPIFNDAWDQMKIIISSTSHNTNDILLKLDDWKDIIKDSFSHGGFHEPMSTRDAASGSFSWSPENNLAHERPTSPVYSHQFKSGPLYSGLREDTPAGSKSDIGFESSNFNHNPEDAAQLWKSHKIDFAGGHSTNHIVHNFGPGSSDLDVSKSLESLQFGKKIGDISGSFVGGKEALCESSEDENEDLIPSALHRQSSAKTFAKKVDSFFGRQPPSTDQK